MQIKSRVKAGVLYVLLCGELDEHSATYTRITLDEMFDKPDFQKIVIDLSELCGQHRNWCADWKI